MVAHGSLSGKQIGDNAAVDVVHPQSGGGGSINPEPDGGSGVERIWINRPQTEFDRNPGFFSIDVVGNNIYHERTDAVNLIAV